MGRELLSSIIQKHPTALSMLLRRVQGVMAELGKVLLLWPLREIWVALPRYSIAAARAALPIPISVCSICLCLNSGTAAHVWMRAALPIPTSVCSICLCLNSGTASHVWIFNVHTDVDACDCPWGLYGHRKRVCTGS